MIPLSEINTIRLDPQQERPLYLQLYYALREAMLQGRLPAHTRLPGSRRLAGALKLSRNTVIGAYDQLAAEGFIRSRTGSGCYVAGVLPDRFLNADPNPDSDQNPDQTKVQLSKRGRSIAQLGGRGDPGPPRPFSPGLADLEELPLEAWTRLLARHWRRVKKTMLAYSDPAGYQPLRRAIADYLTACRGVVCDPERVIIVSGAQQGLDLAGRLLLDPGEPAWVEEPGYLGAKGALAAAGATLIPVPIDAQGLSISAGIQREPKPRLIYITPSHQYPGGRTMTLDRRIELLDFARSVGARIIEDDYDSEFRYHGRPYAALQGLTNGGDVIYIGTFSKVLFPALRLGYMVVPKSLTGPLSAARSFADGQSPTVTQAALAEFIESGLFASHIRKMRALYQTRRDILRDAFQAQLGHSFTIHTADAGMHLVALANNPAFDDQAFSRLGAENGLVLRPLSSYYLEEPAKSGLVLGYAGFKEHTLRQAVKQTADLFLRTQQRNAQD